MEELYTQEEVTQAVNQIHQNYREQIAQMEKRHQEEVQTKSSELQRLQLKVSEMTGLIEQSQKEVSRLSDIQASKNLTIQTLSSDKQKLEQTVQSLTEKIEMQSRSDLKLNELNKKQQDIEQRENKLKEKSISVRVREEENAKKEKTLSDWNAVLKLGFDEVKKRQTEMDEEVKKEAEEITAHHKLRLTKEYCNKLESMKNSLEETKRLWLSEHNMQMILLGVLAIYSFAITFFHGLIWNPGFYEDVNDCVKGSVGIIKKIALWIWNLSGFVAEISDKISSDTASNITNILIRAAIIIGILIFIYVIIKNLGSLLLEHWKRIRMWDRTTLIIAFFLTGTAAIVPEMEINVAATMIGAFICYIGIRSFICMENKDIRNTIIKIIAYLMISAGCFLGFVLFLRWTFSG